MCKLLFAFYERCQSLDNKNFKNVIGKGVFWVDFWALWYGPCKKITLIFK